MPTDDFARWYQAHGQYRYVPGRVRPVLRGSGEEDRAFRTWYSHKDDPPESNGEAEERIRSQAKIGHEKEESDARQGTDTR